MSALAAGAIGSLITLVVAFVVRLSAVPGEVAAHDRRVGERDHSLADWVGDRDLSLRRELAAARKRLAARGALDSGDYAYELLLLKEQALHQWRDQEREATIEVASLYDAEGLLHSAWRRVVGGRKSLNTPDKAAHLFNYWREPPARPGDSQRGSAVAPIDDPTTRTLERVVKDAPSRLNDYK